MKAFICLTMFALFSGKPSHLFLIFEIQLPIKGYPTSLFVDREHLDDLGVSQGTDGISQLGILAVIVIRCVYLNI